MRRTSLTLGALLLASTSLCSAGSLPFNQIVAFGDSLSDSGNAYLVYLNSPLLYPPGAPVPQPPNYTAGRFTDGPDTTPKSAFPGKVWVEDLASQLGLPDPLPSLGGGTNYSVGSAQTGTANPQDMGNQVAAFLGGHGGVAAPTNLYTFWGGSNDLLFTSTTPQQAASNVFNEIQAIASAGGKYFLWVNLPPLGAISGNASQTLAAITFNALLENDINTLRGEFPTDVFVPVDIFSFYEGGAGGLNLSGIGQNSTNPDIYASWDGEHPTNVGHLAIAGLADTTLVAAIPEPAALWTAAFGLIGILGLRRLKA